MGALLHKRRIIVPVVVVCAVALLLTGARFAAYPSFISAPDHVYIVVTRVQLLPTSHTIVFDRQFGSVASEVYAQMVAGQRIPPNSETSCPAGAQTFYHYDLTFSRAGVQTSVATSDAQGCRFIILTYLGGEDVYSWYASHGTSFWARLHQLTNPPEPI